MAKKQKTKKADRQKSKRHIWLWIGLGCFIVLGIVYLYIAQPTFHSVEAGGRLFRQNCAVCHGPGAEGEDPAQPMGGMKTGGGYIAPALDGTGHTWHHADKILFNIIKNGSKAEGSTMQGFKKSLTDEEIAEIIRYFKTLWPKKIMKLRTQRFQQKISDMFTTKVETPSSEGKAVYNKRCSVCHGAKGVGTDKGPPLVHKIYNPNHHADMSFHLAVKVGVRAHHWRFGNMPKIEGVSKEETDMIIKYVRGLQKESGIF